MSVFSLNKYTWVDAARIFAVFFICIISCCNKSVAQSFDDTLRHTDLANPTIVVARSQERSVKINIDIAKSLNNPQIGATASHSILRDIYTFNTPSGVLTTPYNTHPTTLALNLVQPLFTGFQNEAQIRSAEFGSKAQHEQRLYTEQSVFTAVATDYAQVLLYQRLVDLLQTNQDFFRQQIDDTLMRLKHGEATEVDLNNAKSGLQTAIIGLAQNRAGLRARQASFRQDTGLDATKLGIIPSYERLLPATLEKAIDVAMTSNPALRAAIFNVDVARANVSYAEGALLPHAQAQGTAQRNINPEGSVPYDTYTLTATGSVPIYQGGAC